jgi:hypothetical protein
MFATVTTAFDQAFTYPLTFPFVRVTPFFARLFWGGALLMSSKVFSQPWFCSLQVYFYRKKELQEVLAALQEIDKSRDSVKRWILNHVFPDADSRMGQTPNHVDNSTSCCECVKEGGR